MNNRWLLTLKICFFLVLSSCQDQKPKDSTVAPVSLDSEEQNDFRSHKNSNVHERVSSGRTSKKLVTHGKGILNKFINELSEEVHFPGYRYCGPGTKLAERIARNDSGINPLDEACKEHDISYSINEEDIDARNAADKILIEKAWERVNAPDASSDEKTTALTITKFMKLKLDIEKKHDFKKIKEDL